MRYLLYWILAGTVASGALVMTTVANQAVPEPPASPPPAEEPSPPPSPENEQEPGRSQEDELESFTPSEKVPADSAISFPVDI